MRDCRVLTTLVRCGQETVTKTLNQFLNLHDPRGLRLAAYRTCPSRLARKTVCGQPKTILSQGERPLARVLLRSMHNIDVERGGERIGECRWLVPVVCNSRDYA
jgi:hypothetical protein